MDSKVEFWIVIAVTYQTWRLFCKLIFILRFIHKYLTMTSSIVSLLYPITLMRSLLQFISLDQTSVINTSAAPASTRETYSADRIPPPSLFEPKCHPLEKQVTAEVDGYFLQHWPFPNEKVRKKFVTAGFSRVTCLYFPLAKEDRIHFACRLLTLLFLIDGKLYHHLLNLQVPS